MARQTIASTNARIDALESKIDARMDRIEALLSPAAPAKRASAPKASAKPVTQPKAAPKGTKNLTRGNRPEFVAAAPWAKGLSTKDIAMAVISGAHKAPKGWAIGEGYRALFAA